MRLGHTAVRRVQEHSSGAARPSYDNSAIKPRVVFYVIQLGRFGHSATLVSKALPGGANHSLTIRFWEKLSIMVNVA